MRKVGNLARFDGVVEPGLPTRERGNGLLRLVLVGSLVMIIGLIAVAISGAAPGTEASVKNFQQCANGAPPSTATDCPSGWINGILNSNNSHYAEDDVTPQRVILVLPKNGPLTGRTIEIKYQTRKGGVHAYDSLATWNHTQTSADRCGDLNAADCVPGAASTFAIPPDPTVVADSNGSGSATSGHQLAGQVMTMYGGTITGVSVPSHSDPAGSGDEEATLVVTYSVPDLAADRKVMLLFGGHIAPSLGSRGWGVGVGAGSISGGPYHISICTVDGAAAGCRDNQIQSSAIQAPANILIEKIALGGDATFNYSASGSGISGFSIATSGGSGSQSFANLTAGAYTVTESAPPAGWDFTSLQCVDEDNGSSVSGMTANIDLDPGETVTCTYTNTKRGSIIVKKETLPDGDPQSFAFAATYGNFSLSDGQQNDSGLLAPGTYSVSETVPAGWDLTSATCDDGSSPSSIGLGAGETVTCTFTNTKRSTLVVYKQVVNDHGGTAVPSNWQMNVSGPTNLNFAGSATGVSNEVISGSYTVGESGGPSGYGLTYPTTGLPAGVTQNDCNSQGAVTVPPGETRRCVLRNDDQAGSLTVIKHVINDNGGTAVAADFPITVTGNSPSPANFAGAESPGTSVAIGSGAYNVTEVEDAGYAVTYSADCSGTIALGESKTCTITNDDRAASLTVIKHVINDDGGTKVAAEFPISVSGNSPTPASFPGTESPGTAVAIGPGSYSVTETEDPGYAATYSADCTGTIALGDSRTCTITNDDRPATLTVIKTVINDNGGTAVASDFPISVTGNGPDPSSFPGEESPGTAVGIGPGAYNVTETENPAYTASYSADCSSSIALGESKTCTITNNDVAPSLTLVKEVVNDDGGTALPSAWTLTASGPTGFSGAGPSVSSGVGFDAGSYDLSEAGPAGYAASDWSCTDGQADADTVDVGLGDDITCTIVNNDEPASLTVIKHVVNDNGGTAVAGDFPITVTGSNPNPAGFSGEESPGTSVAIEPGAYSVTEVEDPAYAATYSADCSGTIALGESKTCTITNNDIAASLTLVKQVVNDDGGLAQANSWTLTASGPTGFSGLGPSVSSGASFDAGTYDLSEAGPAGYAASDWSCDGGQVDADTVSVGLGEAITCTIVNNDLAAELIVRKIVVNDDGGTAQAQDFSFQVNLGTAQAFEADGQNNLTVNAGTYTVTEPAEAGYTTTYNNCSNLVIPNGGSATCTVTNNDVPRGQGSISISKSANPVSIMEPGGPVTFSVTITNTSVDVPVAITNVVDNVFGDLDDEGGNGCFDVPINLAPGEKVNCTFERNITGVGGDVHVNVVTATGVDPAGRTLTASDDARVDITPRLIDLLIEKQASSPTPLNGTVNYTLTVQNKGPQTATNVQVADPAPAGITYLSASPSQGTCSLSPALVTCSLGSIAPGQTVTIAITARATAVGTHTNTATVTGSGGRETNPADNVDSAITVVPAPLKPPTAKPKPEAKPVCLTLTVSPKMIKADGKPDRVNVLVTSGSKRMKGVRVILTGPGVKSSANSNGKGVARLQINPRKAGILTITALEPNRTICGPKRIGVVGVFLPPLTG